MHDKDFTTVKRGTAMQENCWWKDKVIYQIYPMSFCDSNNDGIGDIPGIISKLDYLKALGIGAIWLSPVYPSPNEDNGYDISDYCNIHENYGTLADMDKLIAEAKKRGIRIILDLVINHTSNRHEWFEKSRQRIEPYTDFYIWRSGNNGKKPSKWGSFFGEDCWEWDEVRKEYYLHLFAKGQPDLNYHNEKVIEAVENVMRFWLDRGVAGFRCDVINILYKESLENGKWRPALRGCENYISTEGTHKILRRFNEEVLSKYNAFTVGETVFVTPKMADDLVNPERHELNTVFSFEHMETDCYKVKWFMRKFLPNRFFKVITKWQNALAWNTVYLENHDQPRSVSRFGDDKKYHDISAKALATLLLTLRGTPFVFEGEEIGMTNFDFSNIKKLRDIESKNILNLLEKYHVPKKLRFKMIKAKSRDNARTPMLWTDGIYGGFSDAAPWLVVNHNRRIINVAAQIGKPDSVLTYYRKLIAVRNASETLKHGNFKELYRKGGVYAYERSVENETLRVVINLTGKVKTTPITGKNLISNYNKENTENKLLPYEAAVIRK